MTEPQRFINTFYAFCSLILPGLGQLLQKRAGAALGFFVLFVLTVFFPVLMIANAALTTQSTNNHKRECPGIVLRFIPGSFG